jgi:hypothetical protein
MTDSADTEIDRGPKRSGRQPEGPAHPRKGSAMQTLKRTASEFSEDNLTDSAAALTYYAVLSIFPPSSRSSRSSASSATRRRSPRR